MSLLSKLFLGAGTFKPELRAEFESEGIVVIAEDCPGRIHYSNFKAPGKRFNGKVQPLRVAIAVTRERLAVYSHGGRADLIDSPFSSSNFGAVEIALEEGDRISFRIDYDRLDDPRAAEVSGVITIRATTPQAPLIAEAIRARVGG